MAIESAAATSAVLVAVLSLAVVGYLYWDNRRVKIFLIDSKGQNVRQLRLRPKSDGTVQFKHRGSDYDVPLKEGWSYSIGSGKIFFVCESSGQLQKVEFEPGNPYYDPLTDDTADLSDERSRARCVHIGPRFLAEVRKDRREEKMFEAEENPWVGIAKMGLLLTFGILCAVVVLIYVTMQVRTKVGA